jgi:peptidylprolyl isomerase
MAYAKKGDKVIINYIGKLEDGTVFDSTFEDEECDDAGCDSDECDSDDCGCGESGPMELIIGEGEFFVQIEDALVGMSVGEKKTVLVPAKDAFGEYDKDKVFEVPRSDMPEDLQPEIGDELTLTGDDDEEIDVTVVEVNKDAVTFDSNHPLAGEDLTFELELTEII